VENEGLNTTEYIKLIKESPEKKKGYIFAGVTVFVSILLIVFAIRPTIITITQINSSIKEKNRLNTALEAKINTLSALDKQYDEIGSQLDDLALIYPSNENFSLLLANIESVLSKNSFSLVGVDFNKYSNKNVTFTPKVLVPWTMQIVAKGNTSNVVNLLKSLEALPMYPVIETFSYSDQKDEKGLTSFSISLRIYKIDNANFYR
jgi:Tfp pilus assembly protein PilO